MYFVYLIQHDITKQIYIGNTNNLKRRLQEHNLNRQQATIRKTGNWVPVYIEIYRSREDALGRERKLKSHGSGKQELKKRIKRSLLGS